MTGSISTLVDLWNTELLLLLLLSLLFFVVVVVVFVVIITQPATHMHSRATGSDKGQL